MRDALARKHHRQQALLRVVSQQRLSTQGDVVRALRGAGFAATQATVSRDIVELGLVKVARDGTHAYAPPSAAAPGGGMERLRRFCEDYPVEVLHRDVVGPVPLAAVVDADDVLVLQAGGARRLAARRGRGDARGR